VTSIDPTVLLSIRPRFAELIMSGAKTVELRRCLLRVSKGQRILLYVSSPQCSVVGTFEVRAVESTTPARLWELVKHRCALSRREFNEYYAGARRAVGIFLCNPQSLESPISLVELRRRILGFHPPQSFRYLTEPMLSSISARR
jgi:predicted transcriptional regulator